MCEKKWGNVIMKKQVIMTLVASFVISGVGTAFAAEDADSAIKFDGSFSVMYRTQRDNDKVGTAPNTVENGVKSTFMLNVDVPLSPNFDAYSRLIYQKINSNYGAFAADYIYNTTTQNQSSIDEFGLKYKNDGVTYIVGSQQLTLGAGLAYDNWYIGQHALPYAINIKGKVGATNLNVIVAETNYQAGIENDKFYVLQGNYDVSTKTNIGAMFAHVSYGKDTVVEMGEPDNKFNFYSVYATHKLTEQATLSGEYLVSSAKSDNQGFITNLSYKLDSKNSVGVGAYYVQDQTCINDYNGGCMTTSPNNNTTGVMLSWNHKIDKNTSFSLADTAYTKIKASSYSGGGSDRNRFSATVSTNF